MATVTQPPDIRTRLAACVSSILAMPHAAAMQNLSALEMAFECGRQVERQALGFAPRPSRPRLSLVAGP